MAAAPPRSCAGTSRRRSGGWRARWSARRWSPERFRTGIRDLTEKQMSTAATPRTRSIPSHGLFIDGKDVPASSDEHIDVHNPATGEVIARTAHGTAADVDRAIKSAARAFESKEWGGMDVRARARLVNRIADAFEARPPELVQLETTNNGRPVNETRAQVSRIPDFFRYNAGLALSRRDAVVPVEGPYLAYTLRTPIGVVGNSTPFNHPLMILCKSLAPVLASGCTTVVKPSEYTPLTTLLLATTSKKPALPTAASILSPAPDPTPGKPPAGTTGPPSSASTAGTPPGPP